jgi:TRAP-type mannitol/chloroaromatic compound transport system permease small subunit
MKVGTGRAAVVDWLMKINLACGVLSGIALLLMMVVGALDVVGTNLDMVGVPSLPVPAAFEFMATMMVVSVFLAMALGQARRAHIRVEVLVNKLPRPLRKLADLIRHGLSMAFFMSIAYFGALSAIHSFGVGEYAPGIINFPIWPARLFLAFGASLISIQCALDLIGIFSRRFAVNSHPGATAKPLRID